MGWIATTHYSVKPGAPCFFCETSCPETIRKINTNTLLDIVFQGGSYSASQTIPCCLVCSKKLKVRFIVACLGFLFLISLYIAYLINDKFSFPLPVSFSLPFIVFGSPGIYMGIQGSIRKRRLVNYAAKYFVRIAHEYENL
jgi:hypothetical protein